MTVEEALQKVLDAHKDVLTSLQELRMIVKEEGSFIIQDYVKKEDFASAQTIIAELDSFTKVQFDSNMDQISSSISTIFGNHQRIQRSKPAVVDPPKVEKKEEKTNEPIELLDEAVEAFKQRHFSIHKIEKHHIEISKDNLHYYFTPVYGNPTAEFYQKVMEEKNELKNIGFICATKETLETAKKHTLEWTDRNKSRCKFLNIRFATIEDIKHTPKMFETIPF